MNSFVGGGDGQFCTSGGLILKGRQLVKLWLAHHSGLLNHMDGLSSLARTVHIHKTMKPPTPDGYFPHLVEL